MNPLFSTERINAYVAEEADLDRVVEIQSHPENRDYTWLNNKEEYLDIIKEEGVYILAFRKKGEAEIMGYAYLVHSEKIDSLEFRRLAVMDKSHGYGQEIVRGIQAFAFTKLKVHRLWLEVYTFNHKAIYLYEKLQFKREGTLRDAYKDHRGYLSQHTYSMLADEYRTLDAYNPVNISSG